MAFFILNYLIMIEVSIINIYHQNLINLLLNISLPLCKFYIWVNYYNNIGGNTQKNNIKNHV
jgi:hypothetical protein